VSVEEVPVPLRAASKDEWWARSSALAGPLAQILSALPDEARKALRARALAEVNVYDSPTGLELPGVGLLASARSA
jgi:hypothetical protein